MQCTWIFNRGKRKGESCGVSIFKKHDGPYAGYCSKHRKNALTVRRTSNANDIHEIIQRHKETRFPKHSEVYTEGNLMVEEMSSSDDEDSMDYDKVEKERPMSPIKKNKEHSIEEDEDSSIEELTSSSKDDDNNDSSEDNDDITTSDVMLHNKKHSKTNKKKQYYNGDEFKDTDLNVSDIMDEDSEELEYLEKEKKKNKYKKFKKKQERKKQKKKKNSIKKKKKPPPSSDDEEEDSDEDESDSDEGEDSDEDMVNEAINAQAQATQEMNEYSRWLVTTGYTVTLHTILSTRGHSMQVAEDIAHTPLVQACIKSLCNKRKKMLPDVNKSPELCLLLSTGAEVAKVDPGLLNIMNYRRKSISQPQQESLSSPKENTPETSQKDDTSPEKSFI